MSSEMKFDAADLEGLSPEERAALTEDVGDEAPEAPAEDAPAPQAEANDDAPAEDAAPQDDGKDAAAPEAEAQNEAPADGAPDAAADEAPETETKDEAPAEAAPAPAPAQPTSPYSYNLPAEFAERAKALQERQSELEEKLSNGDIDATKFIMEQRELTREQAKLDAMQFRAEMAAEMQQQAVQRAREAEGAEWARAMQELAGQLGDGAPDYLNAEADGMALAQQARAIMTARGIPEGTPVADKLAILHQAHRMVLLARGVSVPQQAAPAEPVKPDEAKGKVMAARKADLSAAPTSLGTVQGADSGSTDALARLDDLEGEQLEDAVAKLARTNPAAYEKWLAAA